MCNLYSMTSSQQAIRELSRAMRDVAGNLRLLPGIFPDYPAPIVRTGADGMRELARARWGMPSPAFVLEGKKVDKGVTNVRNPKSPHWRRWLGPPARYLVPFSSFSESARGIALGEDRPLAFFAGIWTGWTSKRLEPSIFGHSPSAPASWCSEDGDIPPVQLPAARQRSANHRYLKNRATGPFPAAQVARFPRVAVHRASTVKESGQVPVREHAANPRVYRHERPPEKGL